MYLGVLRDQGRFVFGYGEGGEIVGMRNMANGRSRRWIEALIGPKQATKVALRRCIARASRSQFVRRIALRGADGTSFDTMVRKIPGYPCGRAAFRSADVEASAAPASSVRFRGKRSETAVMMVRQCLA